MPRSGWLRGLHPDFGAFNATWRLPATSWDAFAALTQIEAPYRRVPLYQRSASGEDACAKHRTRDPFASMALS